MEDYEIQGNAGFKRIKTLIRYSWTNNKTTWYVSRKTDLNKKLISKLPRNQDATIRKTRPREWFWRLYLFFLIGLCNPLSGGWTLSYIQKVSSFRHSSVDCYECNERNEDRLRDCVAKLSLEMRSRLSFVCWRQKNGVTFGVFNEVNNTIEKWIIVT